MNQKIIGKILSFVTKILATVTRALGNLVRIAGFSITVSTGKQLIPLLARDSVKVEITREQVAGGVTPVYRLSPYA